MSDLLDPLALKALGVLLLAALAGWFKMKHGVKKANERTHKAVDDAAAKLKEAIHAELQEDLDEIDARPVTDNVVADLEARLRSSRGKSPGPQGAAGRDPGSD